VASAIVTLNFRYLRKIMEGFFSMAVDKQGEGPQCGSEALRAISKQTFFQTPHKFLVLIALVVVVVIWGNVNMLFFIIGLRRYSCRS